MMEIKFSIYSFIQWIYIGVSSVFIRFHPHEVRIRSL